MKVSRHPWFVIVATVALLLWPVTTFAATPSGSSSAAPPCDSFSSSLGLTGASSSSTNASFVATGPTINGSLPGPSTAETFCLPGIGGGGDLIAIMDYTPADPLTSGRFGNAFGVQVFDASNNSLLTTWSPDQCRLGHAIFTLSPTGLPNSGPFLLRFSNFTPNTVDFTMMFSGPGASVIPGADTSATIPSSSSCP